MEDLCFVFAFARDCPRCEKFKNGIYSDIVKLLNSKGVKIHEFTAVSQMTGFPPTSFPSFIRSQNPWWPKIYVTTRGVFNSKLPLDAIMKYVHVFSSVTENINGNTVHNYTERGIMGNIKAYLTFAQSYLNSGEYARAKSFSGNSSPIIQNDNNHTESTESPHRDLSITPCGLIRLIPAHR